MKVNTDPVLEEMLKKQKFINLIFFKFWPKNFKLPYKIHLLIVETNLKESNA